MQLSGVASTGLSDFKTQVDVTLGCMFPSFYQKALLSSSFSPASIFKAQEPLEVGQGVYPHFADLESEAQRSTVSEVHYREGRSQ